MDATVLRQYPVGRRSDDPVAGFIGGTEHYLHKIAAGLAEHGHVVHVVTPDLERMEGRGDALFYWPPTVHPTHAECVIAWHSLSAVNPHSSYRAPILICATNGLGADFGPGNAWAKEVDAWPVFSECHRDLLCSTVPQVDRDKCFVTGLGVDLADYRFREEGRVRKVPGRIFVANDPARGLWHVLDIFDIVRQRIPDASLHIGYHFDRSFDIYRWEANAMAETMWECKRRIESTPGVVNLGALSRTDLVQEQDECQVHIWPSDPPNLGSQIHGITQMECAAAGAALVLSDVEAFPEVFGKAATILPVPGTYVPQLERRYDAADWAEAVVKLMQSPKKCREARHKAMELAERHTWTRVVADWMEMLATLEAGARASAEPVPA